MSDNIETNVETPDVNEAEVEQATEPVVNGKSVEAKGKPEPTDVSNFTTEQNKQLIKHAESIGKTVKQVIASGWQPKAEAKKEDKPTEAKPAESKDKTAAKVEDKGEDKADSAPKKYKVKVDGADLEVDEKELVRGYTHNKAATQTFREGQIMRKQALELLTKLKDPDALDEVLVKLGHDPEKLYEKRLAARIEDDMLTPEEKELKDYRRRFQALELAEKAKQEEAKENDIKSRALKMEQDLTEEFSAALEKVEFPDRGEGIRRMARYVAHYAKMGIKLPAEDAALMVKDDIKNELQSVTKNMSPTELYKFLGEEAAKAILQERGKQVAKTNDFNSQKGDSAILERRNGKKPMSPSEWRKWNNS